MQTDTDTQRHPRTSGATPPPAKAHDLTHLCVCPLSMDILRWLKKNVSMDLRGLRYETCAPTSTLKLRLRGLIAEGLVLRHSRGRSTWYTLGRF